MPLLSILSPVVTAAPLNATLAGTFGMLVLICSAPFRIGAENTRIHSGHQHAKLCGSMRHSPSFWNEVASVLGRHSFTGASLFGARNAARLSVDRNGVGDLLATPNLLQLLSALPGVDSLLLGTIRRTNHFLAALLAGHE